MLSSNVQKGSEFKPLPVISPIPLKPRGVKPKDKKKKRFKVEDRLDFKKDIYFNSLKEQLIALSNTDNLQMTAKNCRKLNRKEPNSKILNDVYIMLYYFAGKSFLKKNYDEFLNLYHIIYNLFPKYEVIELLMKHANSLMQTEEYAQALKLFQYLEEQKITALDQEIYYEKAKCYEGLKDYKSALNEYLNIIKNYEVDVEIYKKLADLHFLDSNYKQACKAYSFCYEFDISKEDSLTKLMEIANINYELASEVTSELKILLKKNHNNIEVLEGIATLYKQQNDYKKAIKVYRRLDALNPANENYLKELKNCNSQLRNKQLDACHCSII